MAIGTPTTPITDINDTATSTTYSFASHTYTNGDLWLVVEHTSDNTSGQGIPPSTVAISGGLGWTMIRDVDTEQPATIRSNLSVWWAIGDGSTGVVTLTYADAQTSCGARMVQISGTDTTTPIVQSAETGPSAGTSISVTLASFEDASNNMTFIAVGQWAPAETMAADGSLTELDDDITTTAPTTSVATSYLLGQDTTPSMSWSTSKDAGGIAIEIRDPSGGATTRRYTLTTLGVG